MYTKRNLFLAFFKSNRALFLGTIGMGFCATLGVLFIPLLLGKFYQLSGLSHSARGKIFDYLFGKTEDIQFYFSLFFGVLLLKFLADYLSKLGQGIAAERIAKHLREKLFHSQIHAKLEAHQKKNSGLYLLRYSGDLGAIQNYVTKGLIGFTNDCLFLVLALTLLFLLNAKITIVVLGTFPVLFLVFILLNRQLKKHIRARRNRRSNNLSFVASRLGLLQTLKVFNRQPIEEEKFRKGSQKLYDNSIKYYRLYALINALLPFLTYGMLGLVLVYVYYLKSATQVSLSGHELLTFIMTMINIIPVFKRILNVNYIWQSGAVSIQKIIQLLNVEKETTTIKKGNREVQQDETSPLLAFQDISFRYPEGATVFKSLSFEIPPNSIVLLEGEHQSGKSTVFKLLLGLFDVHSGAIKYKNININQWSTYDWRKNITVASEDFPLMGRTIFEAISYSRKSEKKPAALQILKELGYCEPSASLDILNTPLQEHAKNISFSQRKLLGIARALLTKKKIILLDEPFEGLSEEIIANIIVILHEMRLNHTIVIIAQNKQVNLKFDKRIQLNA